MFKEEKIKTFHIKQNVIKYYESSREGRNTVKGTNEYNMLLKC